MGDDEVMCDGVERVGRHARSDGVAHRLDGLCRDPTGRADSLDLLSRVDVASGVSSGPRASDVFRSGNARGDRTEGTDEPGDEMTRGVPWHTLNTMGDAAQGHGDSYFEGLAEEAFDAIADPQLEPEWWYNVVTREVEEGPQSLGSDRLGPFKTREGAEHAEAIIAERARAWNAEDE